MTNNIPKSGTRKTSLNLISLSDVEPKSVKWLWPNVIPKGKLSLLAGHPGQGKSTLTAEIAAIVSTGRKWPVSGVHADVGKVTILSAEDDVADTITPRVMAAGGDLDKITFLDSVVVNQKERSFDLSTDLKELEELDTDLLIIDPFSAYLSGIDTNNNADVRNFLKPLTRLMEQKGLTILAVSHLNKSEKIDAISRVSGSMAFVAVARAVHYLQPDPDNSERRLFFPQKNNLGRDGEGFAFSIEPRVVAEDISTSAIVWEDDYITIPGDFGPQSPKRKSELERAMDFVKDLLTTKDRWAEEVFRLGKEYGFSEATLNRAKKELGIKPIKGGMNKGWVWSLPQDNLEDGQDTEDAQDEGASLMSTFDEFEHLREGNGRS